MGENPYLPNQFESPGRNVTDWRGYIPGLPGQYFDYQPGARGPASGGVLSEEDKFIGKIADAIRQGLTNFTLNTEPSAQVFPPVISRNFTVYQRVLVTLQPVADAEQLNSQTNVEIANRQPLARPLVDTLNNNNWTTVTNGMGEAAGLDVPPGHCAIIDRFGVSTFSELAEFDLLWSIGVGTPTTGGVTLVSAPNQTILPQVRGWRYGTADHPAPIFGNRVVLPTQDPLRVSVFVTNSATTAGVPLQWKPTAYYVEVALTGWLVPGFKPHEGSEGYKPSVDDSSNSDSTYPGSDSGVF
jgi:hypothetical protein